MLSVDLLDLIEDVAEVPLLEDRFHSWTGI
jgi:hypothetical protein